MKKLIGILLGIMVLVFSFGCSKKEDLTTLEKIKQKGELVIGTSASYPPYEFHKEVDGKDEIVGFDIDIAKELAKELGVKLTIKDMKFDGLIAALTTNKIDIIIAGMTPTEERKQTVDFSDVYYTATQSIVIHKDDIGKFKSLDDLKNSKIGVQKGTIQEQIAKEITNEEDIKGLAKAADVVLQLKSKKIDALIFETPVAKAYASNNNELVFTDLKINSDDNGSAIAINLNNDDLKEVLNEALKKLKSEGKIYEFVANYSIEGE
ncbi:transporter substrate-binding domain-containing protein [Peptostreptococcaceae bacterium AGR-M142]